MKNKFITEITVTIVLIVILVVLVNPYNIFMTNMFHMMLLGISVAVFGFLASLLLKEKAVDEREEKHRSLAGRIAFLSGSSVLLLGIIFQSLNDTLDIWLVTALIVMVVAKVVTRIYTDKYL